MSLTEEDVRRLAAQLWDAEQRSVPVEPISRRHPGADVDDAYRIQLEGVRLRVAQGDSVRGHKVGLTARVMQQQFGVDRPDFGHLLGSMFHPEGEPLPDWHYLICGDREEAHRAGISVRGWTISETLAGDLENHIVERPL